MIEFRDRQTGRALIEALHAVCAQIPRERVAVMHVCGTHEQAIARFGLRASLPPNLDLVAGPATDNAVGQRFVERQGVPAHNARVNGPALGAFVLGKVRAHLGPRA